MPGCGHSPLTRDDIFPNFLLNKVITSGVKFPGEQVASRENVSRLTTELMKESESLSVKDVDSLIATLMEKRRTMHGETHLQDIHVCADFLRRAWRQREQRKQQLEMEMQILDSDLALLQQEVLTNRALAQPPQPGGGGGRGTVHGAAGATTEKKPVVAAASAGGEAGVGAAAATVGGCGPISGEKRKWEAENDDSLVRVRHGGWEAESIYTEARTPATPAQTASEALSEKTRRVCSHFDDLQEAYFEAHRLHESPPDAALRRFQHSLFKFTRFSAFNIFSELKWVAGHVAPVVVSVPPSSFYHPPPLLTSARKRSCFARL